MVWWGFVIGSRYGSCFHSFYEFQMSHNIDGDVRLLKWSCSFLVQILFSCWINPLCNETYRKVWGFLFVDMLKPFMLFIKGLKIRAPSTWDVEVDYLSIEGFDISMAMSFVRPSKKWANISMPFSGGRTSLPHWANNAFAHGCALEYITTPTHPLPSYR